jgi:hypothetical protein
MNEIDAGDWKRLFECPYCATLWSADDWDKYADQVVIRTARKEGWKERDATEQRKQLLLKAPALRVAAIWRRWTMSTTAPCSRATRPVRSVDPGWNDERHHLYSAHRLFLWPHRNHWTLVPSPSSRRWVTVVIPWLACPPSEPGAILEGRSHTTHTPHFNSIYP